MNHQTLHSMSCDSHKLCSLCWPRMWIYLICFMMQKIIIGGDFNTHFTRNTTHSNFMRSFCDSLKLCSLASHNASRVDCIYNFCMQRFSLIDHFITSAYSHVLCYDVDNCSDHDPIRLIISKNWSCDRYSASSRVFLQ